MPKRLYLQAVFAAAMHDGTRKCQVYLIEMTWSILTLRGTKLNKKLRCNITY